MPELDLNLLTALDALLADGSVAGAAQRLGLSASAMSRTWLVCAPRPATRCWCAPAAAWYQHPAPPSCVSASATWHKRPRLCRGPAAQS
jgi:hypothetical protein